MSPETSELAVLLVNTHPVCGLHVSVVQTFVSSQTIGDPGWQLPPPQVSPVVHALPSSQGLVLLANTHPVAGLHESFVHGLLSLQTVADPAWHVPPPHVSPVVQGLPSSQALVLFAWKQPVTALQRSFVQGFESLHWVAVVSVKTHPVAGLQLSAVHTLLSLHTTAVPGRQTPV